MNDTFKRVYEATRLVPRGTVTSYGDIAKRAGLSRGAARVVGWALKALPEHTDVPWQRVVNRAGFLTIINPRLDALEQRHRLEAEGVKVEEKEGALWVDKSFFW